MPRKIEKDKIKVSVELLTYDVTKNPDSVFNDKTIDGLKYLFEKFVDESDRLCKTRIAQFLHTTFSQSFCDWSITVCKFDKGNGVAILNSTNG